MDWSTFFCSSFVLLACLIGGSCLNPPITPPYTEVKNEVKYELGLGEYYSKQTGINGDSLVFGSEHSRSLFVKPKHYDYRCEKKESSFDDKIRVRKRSTRSFDMNHDEASVKEVEASEYFIYTKKEIWSCFEEKKTDILVFYRIVRELMSIKEIYDIKYYEGVDVSTVNYFGNGRRMRIREIAYKYENGTALKYEDKLYLEVTLDGNSIPNLIQHHVLEREVVDDIRGKKQPGVDFWHEEGQKIRSVSISPDGEGRLVKIGYSLPKKHYQPEKEGLPFITCERQQGMNPYPRRFLPECYVQLTADVTSDSKSRKIYAKVSDKQFEHLFAVIRNEVWLCADKNKKIIFYRVLNEVIVLSKTKMVKYEQGIVALASIRTSTNEATIRFTEISFFDANTVERMKYASPYYLSPDKLIQSKLPNGKVDISYKLKGASVYRTLITPQGFDIRVGSKVITEVEHERTKDLQCKKEDPSETFLPAYDTVFKIKVNYNNLFHNMEQIDYEDQVMDKYYEYISREVWSCYVDNTVHYSKYYRILNTLKVLVPVREIETFDDVEVFEQPDNKRSDGKSVLITELKYFERTENKPVIMGRNVILNTRGSACSPTTAHEKSNGYPVTKHEWDETVQWHGHMTDSFYRLRDFDNGLLKLSHSLDISQKENVMTFNLESKTEQIGEINDVAFCKFNPHPHGIYPRFEILDKDSKVIGTAVDLKDKYSAYFEAIKNDIWFCKLQGEENNGHNRINGFFRVVTRQHLKSKTLNAIGSIRYSDRDKVWNELADDIQSLKVLMINTRYFLTVDNPLIVNYKGYLAIEEEIPPGKWESGTEMISMYQQSRDPRKEFKWLNKILYYVDVPLHTWKIIICAQLISPATLTLVIGSKWSERFASSSAVVRCTKMSKEEGNKIDKELKVTKIWKKSKIGADSAVIIHDYFEAVGVEAWECIDTQRKMKMFRLVSHYNIKPKGLRNIKELSYYDGVTIFGLKNKHSSVTRFQIAEVKYIGEDGRKVLKYEGRVSLPSGDDSVKDGKLMPKKLNYERALHKEIAFNFLKKDEIFKIDVGAELNRGLVFEIGQKIETFIETPTLNCEFSSTSKDNDIDKEMLPKVIIIQRLANSVKRKELSIENILEYFYYTQHTWTCDSSSLKGRLYLRVKNELASKEEKNKETQTVYHHDGVTVSLTGALYIEEIEYYSRMDKKLYKFGGIIEFLDNKNELSQKETEKNSVEAVREINYTPDGKIMHYMSGSTDSGIVLEVGTSTQGEIHVDEDHSVKCVEVKDHKFSKSLKMRVSAVLPQEGNTNTWQPIPSHENSEYFNYIQQELWKCKGNGALLFYRVVNILHIYSLKVSGIYYHETNSVTLRTAITDDDYIRITEEKIVKDLHDEITYKYEGNIILQSESEAVLEKLFYGSKYYSTPATKLENDQSRSFTLEELLLLAKKLIKSMKSTPANSPESSTSVIRGVTYSSGKDLHMTIVKGGHRIFEIGTPWLQEVEDRSAAGYNMNCTEDVWTQITGSRYIPRIVEYIAEDAYYYGDEEFHENFQLKGIEVWLCTNEVDDLIRVVTRIEGKIPIFAVKHPDGVVLEKFQLQPNDELTSSVRVTETIYINPLNSEIVKYGGSINAVKAPVKEKVKKPIKGPVIEPVKNILKPAVSRKQSICERFTKNCVGKNLPKE